LPEGGRGTVKLDPKGRLPGRVVEGQSRVVVGCEPRTHHRNYEDLPAHSSLVVGLVGIPAQGRPPKVDRPAGSRSVSLTRSCPKACDPCAEGAISVHEIPDRVVFHPVVLAAMGGGGAPT